MSLGNGEASSSSDPKLKTAEKCRRTDFSIETLLRKQPESTLLVYGNDTEDNTSLRYSRFCPDQGVGPEFESDRDSSSSSPEPIRPVVDPNRDSRYFGFTEEDLTAFPWLNCTRFKPPKLPRTRKRVGCKRYGRGPRIPFAPHQIAVLESTFSKSQYLSSDCIHSLADTLHLSETRVKIWFQNRRARFRREREASTINFPPDNGHVDLYSHFQHRLPQNPQSGDGLHVGQPLDFSRTLEKKSFEQFMTLSPDSNNHSSDRRKLLFPDLIAQQLQRYREVQEYISAQERGSLDTESQFYANSSMAKHTSILQSVLQSTPVIHLPFQSKVSPPPTADSTDVEEMKCSESASVQPLQFENIYQPSLPHYPPYSIQFR